MLDVAPLFGHVSSHILKELTYAAKTLHNIISRSIARKCVCEGLIKKLSPQTVESSSSQPVILNFEIDVAHMD